MRYSYLSVVHRTRSSATYYPNFTFAGSVSLNYHSTAQRVQKRQLKQLAKLDSWALEVSRRTCAWRISNGPSDGRQTVRTSPVRPRCATCLSSVRRRSTPVPSDTTAWKDRQSKPLRASSARAKGVMFQGHIEAAGPIQLQQQPSCPSDGRVLLGLPAPSQMRQRPRASTECPSTRLTCSITV